MLFSERNRKNIISRWEKIHQKDLKYIEEKGSKFKNLKARICGFIAGDGHILTPTNSSKHHTVRFFPDHPSLVTSFNFAFSKVYGKMPNIKEKKNHFRVYLDSKPIVKDLIKIGTFGTMTWTIPSFVLENNTNKIEWIRAFFDCEAHIHRKYIRVQSVNRKGLLHLKMLLKDLGINSRIYKYEPKNKNWNTNFMLTIYRKQDKEKYMDIIGFNHTAKFKRLNKILSNS